jgi:hypothetical protein
MGKSIRQMATENGAGRVALDSGPVMC